MLIGASSGAIQLLKDLGSFKEGEINEEFSHIEIPNIKIPKIEIPKIEIPAINFSKLVTKTHKPIEKVESEDSMDESYSIKNAKKSETVTEENADKIIDSLFIQQDEILPDTNEDKTSSVHKVDPDDFVLYKKYLG